MTARFSITPLKSSHRVALGCSSNHSSGSCAPQSPKLAHLPARKPEKRLLAIAYGRPHWSNSSLGSTTMTVRAEKSTRLPSMFDRIRPSLPFRRIATDSSSWPFFLSSGFPSRPLSIKLSTACCRASFWYRMSPPGLRSAKPRSKLLALKEMPLYNRFKSSGNAIGSLMLRVRRSGGSTGRSVRTIHSGDWSFPATAPIILCLAESFTLLASPVILIPTARTESSWKPCLALASKWRSICSTASSWSPLEASC
mmetsp:Transcript_22267/g.39639  ORF Transcript_22267/g.39639 Transcript_22267/m.39639 type:complete len:253 (+) Transcript_22267:683-1441(+)